MTPKPLNSGFPLCSRLLSMKARKEEPGPSSFPHICCPRAISVLLAAGAGGQGPLHGTQEDVATVRGSGRACFHAEGLSSRWEDRLQDSWRWERSASGLSSCQGRETEPRRAGRTPQRAEELCGQGRGQQEDPGRCAARGSHASCPGPAVSPGRRGRRLRRPSPLHGCTADVAEQD